MAAPFDHRRAKQHLDLEGKAHGLSEGTEAAGREQESLGPVRALGFRLGGHFLGERGGGVRHRAGGEPIDHLLERWW